MISWLFSINIESVGSDKFLMIPWRDLKFTTVIPSDEDSTFNVQIILHIKFVDLNNDNVIDAADRYFIGNTLPDLEYSLRIDLDYKNFDLCIDVKI